MKFKSVKTKRKPLNNRFLSAVLGFAFAFAPVPYMISSASIPVFAEEVPTEVSAFIETVEDWADNAEAIANLDANIDYYMPIGFVRAYIVNLQEAYSANTELSISGSQYVAYYRLTAGGTVYASNIYLSNQDSATICRSPHFNIIYTINSSAGHSVSFSSSPSSSPTSFSIYGTSTVSGAYCSITIDDSLNFYTSSYSYSGNSVSANVYTNSSGIPVLSSRRITSSNFVGGSPAQLVFPSGELSKASPWVYYNDTLIPFLQTEFPDVPIDLIPTPYDEPYEPIYPTDFVTGIPKEWTVENPQLPTVSDIEFNDYAYDFSNLQPVDGLKSISDVVRGINFWWWLTEKTLDSLSIKVFYIIFLSLAVLCFVVWYLGN